MVVEVFMEQNRLQETTSILLEALRGNRPDQAQLQTQLLAMSLQQAPKLAGTILQMKMFTHYGEHFIGNLCEKANGLECIGEIMRRNRQNLQVVVQVAIKYHEQMGALKIVETFESFCSHDDIFYFQGAILLAITDPAVHFRCIQEDLHHDGEQYLINSHREWRRKGVSDDPCPLAAFFLRCCLPSLLPWWPLVVGTYPTTSSTQA
ncbi:unnamed protein product [Prorocentrum cordatum]|uniref:Uncharacterized protein n=1 Tax=Prorocentrum cordatum TaxID=2364126 RepID=A0ABN9XV95_9DINO|nr:unnamed protein product [Polarella glacialis]